MSKELSSLAQSALALDSDFNELDRLSGQLERCSLESDQDFEHARKLLAAFGDAGQRIGMGVQLLAKNLEEARQRAEKAAGIVSERAETIRVRQEASSLMLDRFQQLADRARLITESMAGLQGKGREALLERLPGLEVDLDSLENDVGQLERDSGTAGLKGLARNAEAMRQSLQAARGKLRA